MSKINDHAVFARTRKGEWHRVSANIPFGAATRKYEAIGDPFQKPDPALACEVGFWETSEHASVVQGEPVWYLAVRSLNDPAFKDVSTAVLVRDGEPICEPRGYVQLTSTERSVLARLGRKTGDMDSANDAIVTALLDRADTAHLDASTISDYAWSLARFCFPAEARYA